MQALMLAGFGLVLARAGQVQLVQHRVWAERAERSRTVRAELPARRGTLYDRHGQPLALAQDQYAIQFATNEIRDTALVLRVASELRLDLPRIRRAFRGPRQTWIEQHGPFTATEVEALRREPGVRLPVTYRRAYPAKQVARLVLGGLDADTQRGASGLEFELDSLLAGAPGEQVFLRDRGGRRYESPQRRVRDPVNGHDVVLTLDAELQDIAESVLRQTLQELDADGGDVAVLDPHTGEFLALASRGSRGENATLSVIASPFEPGSTAKLFTAAALLSDPAFDSTMTVDVDQAPYAIPGRGQPIQDAKVKPGVYTLAHAIEVSSNVATVKFGELLRPEQHYEMLRAFGFGSRPGLLFPSDPEGRLVRPHLWKRADEGPSMSMGYGFSATPIQLALAYAAIANGGILLAPALVKEVHDPAGRVVYRHRPDTVRRVLSAEVAARLLDYLGLAAGEAGTGSAAQLASFRVAGKTGTSRIIREGRYVSEYYSSFAGVFPAEEPQLVLVVRIENPRGGTFYGGEIAAPVVRKMLEQALQAGSSALNRGRLARATGTVPTPVPSADAGRASTQAPVVVLLDDASRPDTTRTAAVPDVTGRNLRAAALELHRRGFQVRWRGDGSLVARLTPAAGTERPLGSLVTVETRTP
ncbi:MAG: penicillin-binding transpeptidase domain-containing protein [Gemmatimonadales bacterium]